MFDQLVWLADSAGAATLRDDETLRLIIRSRASKTAKGETPKSTVDADGRPLTKRARRDA
jgi:hypothetical protein